MSKLTYDAFISYSHAKDKPIADALQSVAQRLGKPWYKRRAARIFRDDTSLSATPELWGSIEAALANSKFLILMLSDEAAHSKWVAKEVAYWLEHKSLNTILIAMTGGALNWDEQVSDFNWDRSCKLAEVLAGKFQSEPKWIDLRKYRDVPKSALVRDDAFTTRVADFAAAIRNVPKEDLLSEELRQQRRALRLATGAIVGISGLALFAGWLAYVATVERDKSLLRKVRFVSEIAQQRLEEGDTPTAIRLGLEAMAEEPLFPSYRQHPNMFIAYRTLNRAVHAYKPMKILVGPVPKGAQAPYAAHFSPDGRRVAYVFQRDPTSITVEVWDIERVERIVAAVVPNSFNFRFDKNGSRLGIRYRGGITILELDQGKQIDFVAPKSGIGYSEGAFAFLGDSGYLILHTGAARANIERYEEQPDLFITLDYNAKKFVGLRKGRPTQKLKRLHSLGFDASGSYAVALGPVTAANDNQMCFVIYRTSDWQPLPIEDPALTKREGLSCPKVTEYAGVATSFSDPDETLILKIDDTIIPYVKNENGFVRGRAASVEPGAVKIKTKDLGLEQQSVTVLEVYSDATKAKVHYNAPEYHEAYSFSVEETKVLAANLPKPTSQSQDRLRLAFSDGHVREVNLTSQLGRLAPLPQRTARQMYAEHESRAGPSPCEINKDGWLTYRRSSGDEVIKVTQVFIPGKTMYGTPQAACDAEGSRIYVCVGSRLSQVEKTETGYKELPLNQHCNNVGASDLRNYIWVDLGNTACLFPVARPVFDKWHCSERVTRFYVSESKKVLAGFEYGMEPELRLFDYDGFVNRTAVLDDLMYTGFVVSGEKAFAASSEDITVVPSPHSLESAQADVIAYHPFRNREKLISIAKQLVNELPQLTEEQRRRSGIELPN